MSAVMAVRVCAKGICFPTYSDTKPSHKRRDWQQYHTTSDANGCHGRGDKGETQASVCDNGWEHRKQLLVGWCGVRESESESESDVVRVGDLEHVMYHDSRQFCKELWQEDRDDERA